MPEENRMGASDSKMAGQGQVIRHKNNSFMDECVIIKRNQEETCCFELTSEGQMRVRLKRYAIVPIENYPLLFGTDLDGVEKQRQLVNMLMQHYCSNEGCNYHTSITVKEGNLNICKKNDNTNCKDKQ